MAKIPRLQGRPKLEGGHRNKKIDARFTEEEYALILAMEKTFGISKTELVRKRVLEEAAAIIVNAAELIRELHSIGIELGRTGNNINQLARYANLLNLKGILSPVVAERFLLLMEHYQAKQKSLEVTLRQVVRRMGK
ncbi:plasmid mobilization relaxosome protein MobC [Mucilaginibacter limnophilus]|uniref:Plasmid mobilization relaxosome protein MobC n=1 Tax=Mucilaginibacter limnophilus TaxID=1932778 RepID=A0A3S3TFD0_9SPHI|nr:plasmid mobilization relaxosome protein MobC [Mucilaginibacter limnophilus]RVT99728.1 plasmid mobilization relaxosome protein MobC [Mucilaginibacter limnophilus]